MTAAVVLREVSFVNEAARLVLDGVSLSIEPGEAVAFVGHNGGGKTTLLRILAGLVTPSRGSVEVFGLDLARASYDEMRAHRVRVGFVFEAAGLWANRSVEENIALPLRYHRPDLGPDEVATTVRELAREVGIAEALSLPSFRANASVRKRALVARALVLEPDLLLCDEPQVGLVLREARLVAAAIEKRRRARGMTVVFADHDGYLDPYSVDRSSYFENGLLLARPSAAPPADREDPESSPASVTAGFGGLA